MSQVRIAVVGNANVGKTCLLMSYRPNVKDEIPSIFNPIHIEKNVLLDGKKACCNITLCDTGASEKHLTLRKKVYKNTDIILVCFDIMDTKSLQSVAQHWLNEIDAYAPDSLLILIGLKSDLRSQNGGENAIPLNIIQQYIAKFDFIDYVETSALKKKNVDQAFEIAIQEFMEQGGRHRLTTVYNVDVHSDIDPTDIVGTHKKQWAEHLKSMDPYDDNVFGAFSPVMDTTFAMEESPEPFYDDEPVHDLKPPPAQAQNQMHPSHAWVASPPNHMMGVGSPLNETFPPPPKKPEFPPPPKEPEPPAEPQTLEEPQFGSLDTDLESNLSDIYSTELATNITNPSNVKTIEENREINASPPPPSHIGSDLSDPPAPPQNQRGYARNAPPQHVQNQMMYNQQQPYNAQKIFPPPPEEPRRESDSSQLSEVTQTTQFMSPKGGKQGMFATPRTVPQSQLSEVTQSTAPNSPKMAQRAHNNPTQQPHNHMNTAPAHVQNNQMNAHQAPNRMMVGSPYNNVMPWNNNAAGPSLMGNPPQPRPINTQINNGYPPPPKAERELLQKKKNGQVECNVIPIENTPSPSPQLNAAQEKKKLKEQHQAIVRMHESIERTGSIDYGLGRSEEDESEGCKCVLL